MWRHGKQTNRDEGEWVYCVALLQGGMIGRWKWILMFDGHFWGLKERKLLFYIFHIKTLILWCVIVIKIKSPSFAFKIKLLIISLTKLQFSNFNINLISTTFPPPEVVPKSLYPFSFFFPFLYSVSLFAVYKQNNCHSGVHRADKMNGNLFMEHVRKSVEK